MMYVKKNNLSFYGRQQVEINNKYEYQATNCSAASALCCNLIEFAYLLMERLA